MYSSKAGKFLVRGTHLQVTPDGRPVHCLGQPWVGWGGVGDSTSAFCEEGARKQALRQILGLLLQGFSKENTYI